jgi:hypothetical protein
LLHLFLPRRRKKIRKTEGRGKDEEPKTGRKLSTEKPVPNYKTTT